MRLLFQLPVVFVHALGDIDDLKLSCARMKDSVAAWVYSKGVSRLARVQLWQRIQQGICMS